MGTLVGAQPRDPQVAAADLERAGALEVLALEVDRRADPRAEPSRVQRGGFLDDPCEHSAGCIDVGEVHARHLRAHAGSGSGGSSSGFAWNSCAFAARCRTTPLRQAARGTAMSAPTMPATTTPAAIARMIASGWMATREP